MWLLNSNMPNRSEKTFDPIRRRDCDGRTDGRTDGNTKDQSFKRSINREEGRKSLYISPKTL